MKKTRVFVAALIFLSGCATSGKTGMQVGLGSATGAYEATFQDGRAGYVIWRTRPGGCASRALAVCQSNHFTLQKPESVDWSRTVQANKADFERRRGNGETTYAIIPLAIENTPFRARIFSPIAAL